MYFLFAILHSLLGTALVIGSSDMVVEVVCEYEDAVLTWPNIPTNVMNKAVYKGNTLVVSWPREHGFNEGPSYKGRLSQVGESAIRIIKADRSDSGTYKLIYNSAATDISEALSNLQVLVPPKDSCIPKITHQGGTLRAELPQEGCGIPMLIPNWRNDTENLLSGNITVLNGRHQPGTYTACAVGMALQCFKGNVDKLCSNFTLHALQPLNESSSVVVTVILCVIISILVIGVVICLVYFIRRKNASGTSTKGTVEETVLLNPPATELTSKHKDTPEALNQDTKLQEQLQMPQKQMHDPGSNRTGKAHEQEQEGTGDEEDDASDFVPGSFDKTMEEEVLRAEASHVDKMNFNEVADMLKALELGNPDSLADAKQRMKEHLFHGQKRELHSQKMLNMVQKTIKKYMDFKKLIIDQYSNAKDLIEKDLFVEEMEEIMNIRFPDFAKVLETKGKELKNYSDEFEIVVVGETSAGKSTFLNVLLGKDVLPSHSLHTTSCLCRLHNSVDTQLEFRTDNGSAKTMTPIKDLDELKATLTEQLKSIDQGDKNSLAVIDIYWPIPWLQEKVVLVDTPGIGERDALTKQVADYVPNAAGYIFIVDSNHAGGIQEGGIIKLLEVIQLSADKTGLQITDLSNLLFVCNKWDRVEQQERGDVSQNTQDKLIKYCGALQDWQTVKFTAKMELKLQEWKANPTKAFEILVGSLEQLMVKSIDRRLGEKFKWILKFIRGLHSIVDARIQSLLMSEEDLDEKLKKSEESLEYATNKLGKYEEVEQLVTAKGEELVNNLRVYLEGSTGKSKLLDWSMSAPNVLNLSKDGPQLVQQRFRDVIYHWACVEPGSVIEASALITVNCREISAGIDSNFSSVDVFNFNFLDEKSIEFIIRFERSSVFMSLLRLYFAILFGAFKFHDSATIMRNATIKVLDHVLEKTLDTFISCSFTSPWQKGLNELKVDLKNKLDSSYMVLRVMRKNRERKNDVLKKLSCLNKEVTEALKCLQDLEQDIQCASRY